MTTHPGQLSGTPVARQEIDGAPRRSGFVAVDAAAVLMAGARARGIVDAFSMMGLGAILLSGTGQVVHANGEARSLMSGVMEIVSEHLAGAGPEANAAISSAIGAGLAGNQAAETTEIIGLNGARLGLRVFSVPDAGDSEIQVVRAVAVLSG